MRDGNLDEVVVFYVRDLVLRLPMRMETLDRWPEQ